MESPVPLVLVSVPEEVGAPDALITTWRALATVLLTVKVEPLLV